jgi:hypothetical protein
VSHSRTHLKHGRRERKLSELPGRHYVAVITMRRCRNGDGNVHCGRGEDARGMWEHNAGSAGKRRHAWAWAARALLFTRWGGSG